MSQHSTPELISQCQSVDKLLRLLNPLNKTPAGRIILQQAQQLLTDSQLAQDRILRGYVAIVHLLLERFRQMLPAGSLEQLELNLIQQRLKPPITMADLASLQAFIKKAAPMLGQMDVSESNALRDALSPLVNDDIETRTMLHGQSPPAPLDTARDNTAQQEQHQQIVAQQGELANKIEDAMQQQEAFAILLESVRQEIVQTRNGNELKVLQDRLINQVDDILTAQPGFARVLQDTLSLLNIVGKSSHKLSVELDQVRVLSLTDELTKLPNRRAFLSRLEDEIGRSQRYKVPLTLALIDLDHFKNVNDKYGHNVGDAILQSYAQDILSIFRHYDMVSRYGGEEFAVILPNTDKAGALRAMYKVQKKAASTYYISNEINLKVPTFSAGLAIHKPGEPIKSLVERTDQALYKAKTSGRNRIELDESYLGEDLNSVLKNIASNELKG